MGLKECYAICGFVLLVSVYSAEGDVISAKDNEIGCKGSVILATFDSSLAEQHSVSILHNDTDIVKNSNKKHKNGRNRRSVRVRNPKNEKKWLKFERVTLIGNCCWNVWNKVRGGEPFQMTIPETKLPGWAIISVQLVEDCTWN